MTAPHRYHAGQKVTIVASVWGAKPARGVYRIVRLLPPEGGSNLYRIRSDLELHDRVIPEGHLRIAH